MDSDREPFERPAVKGLLCIGCKKYKVYQILDEPFSNELSPRSSACPRPNRPVLRRRSVTHMVESGQESR